MHYLGFLICLASFKTNLNLPKLPPPTSYLRPEHLPPYWGHSPHTPLDKEVLALLSNIQHAMVAVLKYDGLKLYIYKQELGRVSDWLIKYKPTGSFLHT